MRTKHTPGDWFVADVSRKGAAVFSDAEQIVYCAAYDKDDIPGTIVPQRPISSEEAHANARLIAAAPKMLEALQAIYHERPRGYQYVSEYSLTIEDIARKAIAKATGAEE